MVRSKLNKFEHLRGGGYDPGVLYDEGAGNEQI